jgi:hypothetical protein
MPPRSDAEVFEAYAWAFISAVLAVGFLAGLAASRLAP